MKELFAAVCPPEAIIGPEALRQRDPGYCAASRKAGLLLAAAACLFAVTMLVPPNPWVHAIRAISEAAMVGGLADWFAVSALFRRIPTGIPFITAHTDVIPRSKDRIADLFSGEADSSEPLDIRRRSSRDELGKPGGQEDEGVPPLVLPFGQFLYADRQPVFVAGEGDGEEMLHILRPLCLERCFAGVNGGTVDAAVDLAGDGRGELPLAAGQAVLAEEYGIIQGAAGR